MNITLKGIGKKFGSQNWVIKDLDFTFQSNNSYAIVGHNGSGKSTLLDILANRSKAKKISGKIISSSNKHDFSKEKGFFAKKKKSNIPFLKIWDEDDHKNQGALGSTFRSEAQLSGVAHMIVSHYDMPAIFNHADRIVYMHLGEMIWNDTAQNTFHAYMEGELPKPMTELMDEAVKKQGWDLELSKLVFDRPAVPQGHG